MYYCFSSTTTVLFGVKYVQCVLVGGLAHYNIIYGPLSTPHIKQKSVNVNQNPSVPVSVSKTEEAGEEID